MGDGMGNGDGWTGGSEVVIRINRINGEMHVNVKRHPSGIEMDAGPVGTTYSNALDWCWRLLCGYETAGDASTDAPPSSDQPNGRPLGRPE